MSLGRKVKFPEIEASSKGKGFDTSIFNAEDIAKIETEITEKVEQIRSQFDANQTVFSNVQIYPKSTSIDTKIFSLGWKPGVIANGNWVAV